MRQPILSTSAFTWFLVLVTEIWYNIDEVNLSIKSASGWEEKYYWKKVENFLLINLTLRFHKDYFMDCS